MPSSVERQEGGQEENKKAIRPSISGIDASEKGSTCGGHEANGIGVVGDGLPRTTRQTTCIGGTRGRKAGAVIEGRVSRPLSFLADVSGPPNVPVTTLA